MDLARATLVAVGSVVVYHRVRPSGPVLPVIIKLYYVGIYRKFRTYVKAQWLRGDQWYYCNRRILQYYSHVYTHITVLTCIQLATVTDQSD